MRRVAISLIIALPSGFVFGQAISPEPKFEVASVKLVGAGRGGMQGGPGTADPTRINYNGVTLMQLMTRAYGVQYFQISGPAWLAETRYEVIANVPPGTPPERFNLMLQNLLAERFRLKLHHQTKELSFYELMVAKGGFKLQELASVRRLPNGQRAGIITGGVVDGRARLFARSVPMGQVASFIQGQLGAFVKDKTGLTGYYDFKVEFLDAGTDSPTLRPGAPQLSSALGDLGLRLQKTVGPVDILVVDSVEKQPTEN